MKPALLLPFALLLALGCRVLPARPPSGSAADPIPLARGLAYVLREPGAGPALFTTQEVAFEMPGGQTQTLVTTVENGAQRLGIVASTPLGQTLFTVLLEDGQWKVDARVPLPREFDPRLLAALVQLGNWPLDEVRRGLGPGVELAEEGHRRILRQKGRVLLSLDRDGDAPPFRSLALEIPSLHVKAVIRTLEAEE